MCVHRRSSAAVMRMELGESWEDAHSVDVVTVLDLFIVQLSPERYCGALQDPRRWGEGGRGSETVPNATLSPPEPLR